MQILNSAWDASLLASSAAIFVLGGVIKGAMGVGLPMMVVPMLSLLIPAPQAMGLLVMPVLFSNITQSIGGGKFVYGVGRFWWLIVAQLITAVVAVRLSTGLSPESVNRLMAVAIAVSILSALVKPEANFSLKQERWVGGAVGVFSGVLAGTSTLTAPIIITYLMALRLSRDDFIGSISVIYLLGSIPTYCAMLWYGRFSLAEVLGSCVALMPMFVGMYIGKLVRGKLSEDKFRKLQVLYLCVIAVVLVFK